MKTVYLFDENTKEFISENFAQASPLEPDIYLMPANSTELKPEPIEGEKAVWNGKKWNYCIDLRGEIYFDTETGEAKIISELGQKPDSNWTNIEPPENKLSKWNGKIWIEYPENDKQYDWKDNNWREIIPLAMGNDLINCVERAFVIKEEPTTDEEKIQYFNERKGLQKIFGDSGLKSLFSSPVCNPLPKWFLEIALKDIESSELIEVNYKTLFISLVENWVKTVRFN